MTTRFTPYSLNELKSAIRLRKQSPTSYVPMYGPINELDVSNITDRFIYVFVSSVSPIEHSTK